MFIRNPTCSDPSPASLAAGCTHGSSARLTRPYLRSNRLTRSADRTPVFHRTAGESAPRSCLSKTRSRTRRCTSAGSLNTYARDPASRALQQLLLLSGGTTPSESGRLDLSIFLTPTSSDISL